MNPMLRAQQAARVRLRARKRDVTVDDGITGTADGDALQRDDDGQRWLCARPHIHRHAHVMVAVKTQGNAHEAGR
jgi:hypothetical protein